MMSTVRRVIAVPLEVIAFGLLAAASFVRPGHENDNTRSYGNTLASAADNLDRLDGRGEA